MAARTKTTDSAKNGATLGFEAKNWLAACGQAQFAEYTRLVVANRENLKGIGYAT